MAEIRLNKLTRQFNIGLQTLVDFLNSKGAKITADPNVKISDSYLSMIESKFGEELKLKQDSEKVVIKLKDMIEKNSPKKKVEEPEEHSKEIIIKTTSINTVEKEPIEVKHEEVKPVKVEAPIKVETTDKPNVSTFKVVDKIDLSQFEKKKKVTPEPKVETPSPATTNTPTNEPVVKPIENSLPQKEKVSPNPSVETTKTSEVVTKQENSPSIQTEKKVETQNHSNEKKEQTHTPEKVKETVKEVSPKVEVPSKKETPSNAEASSKEVISPKVEDSPKEEGAVSTSPTGIKIAVEKLQGPVIVDKIDLSQFNKKKPTNKKRERINKNQKVDVAKVGSENNNSQNRNNNNRNRNNNSNNSNKNNAGGGNNNGNNNNGNNNGKNNSGNNSGNNGGNNGGGNNNNPNNNRNNYNRNNNNRNDNRGKNNRNHNDRFKPAMTEAETEEMQKQIQKQIKETYAKMNEGKSKSFGAKHRKEKRDLASQRLQEEMELQELEQKVLTVTEFVTVNDLATLMDNTPVIKVIGACMNLGLMVSINQRLDAEALVLVAEEFGYEIKFVKADESGSIDQEVADKEEDLLPRPPVITVMGHVDHGKTSLLDYIREANVIAGEAGGITQHIGAYNVKLPDGQRITFLDTPGHEAFTAMRARGAKMTDLAIIIVAADDAIMPQTTEAINHAQAAGVPMVFAINKIDKPGANPERIREQLANMNILVEDWGGKYQCQEISAKKGINIDKLLEKVLLEAEMLELKANPNRAASGAVIESSLDKGRGFLATILVQNGSMKVGDMILSGCYTGKVKAMFNERGQKIEYAGPSTPVSVLGINGAPTAGETFNVMADEKEAKDIANKREQLIRIQGIKTQRHMTLEEIGRRIAIGSFKELNVIIKGDVDGSIEALSDSLIKLSTEEVRVNVIHKAVGAVSESDVLLAAASDAIIIGFQVRPSVNARRLAEKEEIEIRLYSVIYDAINEVTSGIEGMLEPEVKEEIIGTAEVLETFKISKVGTIAGCLVREGKLNRTAKVRIIRDGIVIYSGDLGSLKRFKDDVKEVSTNMDCGLNINGYNDLKIGDMVEAYTTIEIKRKL